MAKKNTSGRKPNDESVTATGADAADASETAETAPTGATAEETPPSKPGKPRATEDQAPAGSVGLSDIRKAVAFANSVGGLDKAIALLQIVKVAKEVQ